MKNIDEVKKWLRFQVEYHSKKTELNASVYNYNDANRHKIISDAYDDLLLQIVTDEKFKST